jgi:regulator of protease activity HflC (stomatin/prohibitin superfamily)
MSLLVITSLFIVAVVIVENISIVKNYKWPEVSAYLKLTS